MATKRKIQYLCEMCDSTALVPDTGGAPDMPVGWFAVDYEWKRGPLKTAWLTVQIRGEPAFCSAPCFFEWVKAEMTELEDAILRRPIKTGG